MERSGRPTPLRSRKSEQRQDLVQRVARTERCVRFGVVRLIVAADVDGLTLRVDQLLHDGLLGRSELLGDRGKERFQLRVFVLRGELLSPIQREIEVAAAIVDAAYFARG